MYLNKLTEGIEGKPEFRTFRYVDKNPLGGTKKIRTIGDPNEPMRILHARLICELRKLKIRMDYAFGAQPGKSVRESVRQHLKNRYFYLTDIMNAYQSVDGRKLTEILSAANPELFGEEEETAEFLAKYCLSQKGGLVIGAPASPDLFNVYAAVLMDGKMMELSEKHHLIYTRYLDDLSFSAKQPIGWRKRAAIREAMKEAGFQVNNRKSTVADLKKGPITMNGVRLEWRGVNSPARMMLPRFYLRKIRGLARIVFKRNVDLYRKLAGMMGVFRDSTHDARRLGAMNTTELKLVRRFRECQAIAKRSGTSGAT